MEDPALLVSVLKTVLLLVLIVGAVAVGRELVPMARGQSVLLPADKKEEKD